MLDTSFVDFGKKSRRIVATIKKTIFSVHIKNYVVNTFPVALEHCCTTYSTPPSLLHHLFHPSLIVAPLIPPLPHCCTTYSTPPSLLHHLFHPSLIVTPFIPPLPHCYTTYSTPPSLLHHLFHPPHCYTIYSTPPSLYHHLFHPSLIVAPLIPPLPHCCTTYSTPPSLLHHLFHLPLIVAPLIPPLPHFSIDFRYFKTCSCPKYVCNICHWTLSNQHSIHQLYTPGQKYCNTKFDTE